MTFYNLILKAKNLSIYLWRNIVNLPKRLVMTHRLNVSDRNVVLFYMPNSEFRTGGILSIAFLIDKSVSLKPRAVILPVIVSQFQRIFNIGWFHFPYFFYNLLSVRKKVSKASNILIHVPECLFPEFCKSVERYKLHDITHRATLNILNQNSEAMPSNDIFIQNKHLFARYTMTLAFATNQNINYPYLDMHQHTLSAWFYGDEPKRLEWCEKENLCVVSPDEHPLKAQIVSKIQHAGVQCVEIRNMPFQTYCDLRRRAKWAVTFGEGYDGYFAGAISTGGVGFAVHNELFTQPYIDMMDLIPNVFLSYEEMSDKIVERMQQFDSDLVLPKKLYDRVMPLMCLRNSPQLVTDNLDAYFKLIGW